MLTSARAAWHNHLAVPATSAFHRQLEANVQELCVDIVEKLQPMGQLLSKQISATAVGELLTSGPCLMR